MFCYTTTGMRAIDEGYEPVAGEVLFADYATPEQLAAAFPDYVPPVKRYLIAKSLVQQRLIDSGHIAAAYAALTSSPSSFARWFAPDRPNVYTDDADALALLTAIGADPAVIMALPSD